MIDISSPKPSVLYVDDEPENLTGFKYVFRKFYDIHLAESAEEGLKILRQKPIPVIITDQRMPFQTGVEFLKQVAIEFPDSIRMILTGYSDIEVVIEAINQGGIYQFIHKPWSQEVFKQTIDKALEVYKLRQENQVLVQNLQTSHQELQEAYKELEKFKTKLQEENHYLQQEIKLEHNFDEIISQSEVFKPILLQVQQVAPSDATVLILGETGTGKELLARAIHSISKRSKRPLVKVNCAALQANLIESELFGHEKGAFTGAIERKIGRFELANDGTIFLDEIGELPLELQAKLLRVLQEGEFERLGSSKTLHVNVRVIAATNRDLEKEVANGTFRPDLYYRLNVFPIKNPTLRERKTDIPILVNHFVQKFNKKIGKNIQTIPKKVLDQLIDYDWYGNIRELENIIERAMIISNTDVLEIGNWFANQPKNNSIPTDKILTLDEIEKNHILLALQKTKGKISGEGGAAQLLGINANTLRSRMEKLGISY